MGRSRHVARSLVSATLGEAAQKLDWVRERMAGASRVLRFVDGRVAFVSRPDDVWVATYPRSGTTLMQYLLHRLRGGDDEFDHIGTVVPWYERDLAVGRLDPSDLDALEGPRVFKTHLPPRWVPRGGRTIYIERDGRDVAVSYFHLYREYLGFRGSFDEFFARFLDGDLQYRSYFRHVAGWRARAEGSDVLWVSFEQLRGDKRATIERVVDFLGWDVPAARIDEVVVATQFDAMKRLEAKFDHATALLLERRVRPGRFLRRGASGDGRTQLSSAQLQAFERQRAAASPGDDGPLYLPAFLH